jgi:hypothetical protein
MASTIVTKNSSTASAVPVTGDLTQGELAVNVTDKKLYTKDSGGTVVKLVGGLGNQEANAVAITGGSINGTTVGATTASTGAFTTLSASSTVSGTGFSTYLASPPAIGGTAAAAGSFTTLSASSTTTLSGGTANGVAYLNGSKVLTTGSALTFDGTNALGFGSGGSANTATSLTLKATDNAANGSYILGQRNGANAWLIGDTASSLGSGTGFTSYNYGTAPWIWYLQTGGEQMRLSSTGLGIGTSSPADKLTVQNTSTAVDISVIGPSSSQAGIRFGYTGATYQGRVLYDNASNYMAFTTNGSERARIDSSGNLLVGTTTTSGITSGSSDNAHAFISFEGNVNAQRNNGACLYLSKASGYTSSTLVSFGVTGTERGSITTSGTAVAYNTSSDYRLKDITGSLTGYKERLSALQPKQGSWKADGSEFRGFLAHEFAESYPASVAGEKDAVDADGNPQYQGMQAGSPEVIADLVAYIQEQQALITTLTERITALENK